MTSLPPTPPIGIPPQPSADRRYNPNNRRRAPQAGPRPASSTGPVTRVHRVNNSTAVPQSVLSATSERFRRHQDSRNKISGGFVIGNPDPAPRASHPRSSQDSRGPSSRPSRRPSAPGGERPRRGAPAGGGRGGSGGGMHARGSAANARALQRIKENSIYSLEINEQQQDLINMVPPLAPGDIRIVPICGLEWIGTNMMFIEYQDEIVVIDAGFGFANPSTPGIDYTIPNTAYLKANQHKIKGLIITHGHLDHVGGIPYVIEDLGFPTIYTREFGAVFINKKMEEFPQVASKINIDTIEADMGYVRIGDSENFKVRFFGLTHSIPDSTGVIIQTPLGCILDTGDVRVENEDGVPVAKEFEQYEFLKDEKILLAAIDSTGIEKPGWGVSEQVVQRNVDLIIKEAPGKLFIAAFSSQVERLIVFLESAKKYGKHVAFEGRSMKSNMAITKELQLTNFDHVISIDDVANYPPNKVVVLLTGGRGEEFSALSRIANGTHKSIRLQENDTILLSSSIVPGNDYAVAQLKNNLYRGSYNVITYNDNAIHASGHGRHDELKWIHQQIPYKFFMPIHGEPYMIRIHAKMAEQELHVPRENIAIADNVTIIDGAYLGPLHKVLMDDRKALSEDGMFVVVVLIDNKTGRLKKSPDIISRGFIYLRESKDLLSDVRSLVKRTVESATQSGRVQDPDELKGIVVDRVGKFLLQTTHKEPIVIPVIIGM